MKFFFEWDPIKAQKNNEKHKVSFDRATEIFTDPLALSIYDNEHSISEDRWITIGKSSFDSIIVVIHTFAEINNDNISIRIISARKANAREIKRYKEVIL